MTTFYPSLGGNLTCVVWLKANPNAKIVSNPSCSVKRNPIYQSEVGSRQEQSMKPLNLLWEQPKYGYFFPRIAKEIKLERNKNEVWSKGRSQIHKSSSNYKIIRRGIGEFIQWKG